MAQITVRKLDDDVLDALKARARANKRSTEAEIHDILKRATDAPGICRACLAVGTGRLGAEFAHGRGDRRRRPQAAG